MISRIDWKMELSPDRTGVLDVVTVVVAMLETVPSTEVDGMATLAVESDPPHPYAVGLVLQLTEATEAEVALPHPYAVGLVLQLTEAIDEVLLTVEPPRLALEGVNVCTPI